MLVEQFCLGHIRQHRGILEDKGYPLGAQIWMSVD